jgi:hypothetical protein
MAGYRFEISPVDPCATTSASTLVKGATKAEGVAHDVVVNASSAQIQGLYGYLALVRAGSDTSTVETAISALTP